MANTKNQFSDHIKFYLYSPGRIKVKVNNVIGWEDYGLDAKRNREYHGTLVKVTKQLGFKGEAKNLIEEVFAEKGVIGELRLIRERLVVVDGEPQYVEEEPVYADFYTRMIVDDIVYLNFYSNSLQTLLDAYEDDEFEVERLEDVNNNTISSLEERYVQLKGRSIQAIGSHTLERQIASGSGDIFWATKLISEGPSRHSESAFYTSANMSGFTGQNTFFDRSLEDVPTSSVKLIYEMDIELGNSLFGDGPREVRFALTKLSYNDGTNQYSVIETIDLFSATLSGLESSRSTISGEIDITLQKNEALSYLFYYTPQESGSRCYAIIRESNVKIYEVAWFEPSTSRFIFLHDLMSRLLYIITGKNNKYVSSFFGRTELGYEQDDSVGGLVSVASGLWARGFKPGTENYKSLKISLKDALESTSNCFNLGFGVETINGEEKLVHERLNYFYRDDFAGTFPESINNVEVSVDKGLYYSGLEVGYEKSGGLNQEMGLDEPNGKSQYITPINNNETKFKKLSKIRADEYKLEELRRKSQKKFPNESVGEEDDIWFLDLKRSVDPTIEFEQVHWSDRLDSAPTGIHDPESFRSFLFTPATILRRLANNFLSGIALYKNDFINFISGSLNVTLGLDFQNQDAYKESDNVRIGDLGLPTFGTQVIKFTHPWSREVENLIFGKKEVLINGEKRLVPNYYFKYKFFDSQGKEYVGFFIGYEYNDNPTFEFLLSNDKII